MMENLTVTDVASIIIMYGGCRNDSKEHKSE